jgi:hypothetical protein
MLHGICKLLSVWVSYLVSSSYSLLTRQPCVGLGILHGFITLNFSGLGTVAARPTPNLDDQRLHFIWPLHFDLSDMGGCTRSLRSRLHSSPGHRPPLHVQAAVLEEVFSLLLNLFLSVHFG